jgi:hypothetical protein
LTKALRKYVRLEQKIQRMERDNPWEKIRTKSSRIHDLDRDIAVKNSELPGLQDRT